MNNTIAADAPEFMESSRSVLDNEHVAELVHADIFFFITAIAVIVLSVGVAIIMYYVIGILRDVRAMVRQVRKAGDELEQDIDAMRIGLQKEGLKIQGAFNMILGFFSRQVGKVRRKRTTKDK